jgi:hypothetical protein
MQLWNTTNIVHSFFQEHGSCRFLVNKFKAFQGQCKTKFSWVLCTTAMPKNKKTVRLWHQKSCKKQSVTVWVWLKFQFSLKNQGNYFWWRYFSGQYIALLFKFNIVECCFPSRLTLSLMMPWIWWTWLIIDIMMNAANAMARWVGLPLYENRQPVRLIYLCEF